MHKQQSLVITYTISFIYLKKKI